MMTSQSVSRRGFLAGSTAAVAAAALFSTRASEDRGAAGDDEPDFPLVDFHAHLDNSSIDPVVRLAQGAASGWESSSTRAPGKTSTPSC